jgi:3-oxoacyl-[acyl-carrier-protein] synthase II
MSRRRVVVTGLGALTPLGCSVASLWDGLLAGRSGISPITCFDTTDYPVTFAGEVSDFDPVERFGKKEARKLDRFLQLGLAAADDALADSGFGVTDENADGVAVYLGSGVGGLATVCEGNEALVGGGPKRVSPFVIPKMIINLASGQVSIRTGARGPNLSHVSACATGNHAIGEALRLIQYGDADVAIAGGCEAAVVPIGIAGFARMRALSTRNESPQTASRPFDVGRDGFVMGEGAGVVILEELEHARARGARIYCEMAGYAATADAYHITAPHPEGRGAIACLRRTLRDARWTPDTLDYVNAHGTSTPMGDLVELKAIRAVLGEHGDRLLVSSTKSMTGHLLGAAGGVEAVITALAVHHGVVPPTINLDEPDPECDLDCVPHVAREASLKRAVSNAFGFGGTNATIAMQAWEGA